jgi:hypothetical protein
MAKPQLSGVYYVSGTLAEHGEAKGAGLLLQSEEQLSATLHVFNKPGDRWQFEDAYWRELGGFWIEVHGHLEPPFLTNRAVIEGSYGISKPKYGEGPRQWFRTTGEYSHVDNRRHVGFRLYGEEAGDSRGDLELMDWINLGELVKAPRWVDFFRFHLETTQPWALLLTYEKYQQPLERYLARSSGSTNVFVMMRFRDTTDSRRLREVLRQALSEEGLAAQFADEMSYADELWDNVCTYMLGSSFGIAVVEEIEERSFNPNVALEIGFMQALQRKLLVLKDKRVPMLPSDLIGRLYKEFDSYHMEETIPPVIRAWAEELRVLGLL